MLLANGFQLMNNVLPRRAIPRKQRSCSMRLCLGGWHQYLQALCVPPADGQAGTIVHWVLLQLVTRASAARNCTL